MNLCPACETVSHCLKKGCIPVQHPKPSRLLTDAQIDALARIGCGGDNIRYTFSEEGLRRTLEAYTQALMPALKAQEGL